jgi:Cellulose binding domain
VAIPVQLRFGGRGNRAGGIQTLSRRHRYRGGLLASTLVALLGVLGGGLAASADGPAVDRSGVLPVYPEVTIDPANGRAPADPCYAETLGRQAAEDLVDATRRIYDQDLANWQRGTGSTDQLNESHRRLIESRLALIDARYAEAACNSRLANGGRGDKCRELWLEYNRIADRIAQQEQVVRLHQNDLDRARTIPETGARRLLELQAALAAAKLKLAGLLGDLARQQRKIKDDADCRNTDRKRPEQAPPPRPVPPPNPAPPAPTATGSPTATAAPTAPATSAPGTGEPTPPGTPPSAPDPTTSALAPPPAPTGTDPTEADPYADPDADDPYLDLADIAEFDLDLEPDIRQELGLEPAEPQPTAPSGPTTAPPASASCTATYMVSSQWQGGFQAQVTVRADSLAITGWTVAWTVPSGQTIAQSWNTVLTPNGTRVTAADAAYNGALAADATTTFGFVGASPATNTDPVPSCTAR